ncbi:hypothetical protein D3C76_924430 [compost metagenome]
MKRSAATGLKRRWKHALCLCRRAWRKLIGGDARKPVYRTPAARANEAAARAENARKWSEN